MVEELLPVPTAKDLGVALSFNEHVTQTGSKCIASRNQISHMKYALDRKILTTISINLLVVYRESVNLIGYITRRLSADSLQL